MPLTLTKTIDEAVYNRKEKKGCVSFWMDWKIAGNTMNPTWYNTVMGNMYFTHDQCVIRVNSIERATRIQQLMSLYLPEAKICGIEDLKSLTNKVCSQNESTDYFFDMTTPPITVHGKEIGIYDPLKWLDRPMHILNNLTPREAIQDPIGREKVQLLYLLCANDREEILTQGMQQIQQVLKLSA